MQQCSVSLCGLLKLKYNKHLNSRKRKRKNEENVTTCNNGRTILIFTTFKFLCVYVTYQCKIHDRLIEVMKKLKKIDDDEEE